MQTHLKFEVPAMRIAVKSGGRVKRDVHGSTVYDTRIIPKGRPRLGRTRSGRSVTFTPDSTSKFEVHIREHFFKEYTPEYGVMTQGNKTVGVHNEFLGCSVFGSTLPCTRYRMGKDFVECKGCAHRRKNLEVSITAFLKDDRHIDGDNILKIVLDAMEHVCYYNDTQFHKKHIEIIPYAGEERLVVVLQSSTEHMDKGSLISGYDPKALSVTDAEAYANELLTDMAHVEIQDLIGYLKRRDKRKYVENL